MAISRLGQQIRAVRQARGLSQEALADGSGAGRVTIARLETGVAQDFRIGTLSRLCEALDLELAALPKGGAALGEVKIERERERARRLDRRRRHAELAVRLLALPSAEASAMVREARSRVDRWERERLCSDHYVKRWRARLAGPVRRVARTLVEHDEWTDALLQNTPWSFALPPAVA